jgi:hypothetical protein
VNSRRAQGVSIIIALLLLFFVFVIFRYKTGCENLITLGVGSILGLIFGIGMFGIATDNDLRIGDVLQIKQGMEPITGGSSRAIACKAN